jgi:capsular exopolysaccharide synthesis family protein
VGRALSSEAMADRRVLDDGVGRYTAPDLPPDEAVEVGRYLDAIRRSKWLIALIVVSLTGAVLVISLLLPKTYRATSKLVLERSTQALSSSDAESTQRNLATVRELLTTRKLLRPAVRNGLEGETVDSLRDKVHATVDQDANVISIVATDDTARGAAAIANVVAATFLDRDRREERQRFARARALLRKELADLQASLTPLNQTELAGEIASVRQRLTDLEVSAATGGSPLELAEAAEPPTSPSSPRPVRNALFALFASLFVAALVVLARAQLRPRVGGARELSRLLDLPVMVEVPFVRRRFGHSPNTLSAIEYEAYQTLQASLRMQLPPDRQRTVLVTSALHGEGKTEVTAALGLVLAQAGQKTWLVSADMRWPRLHELFDVAQTPGFAEVLAGGRQGEGAVAVGAREKGSRENGGRLHVLASGQRPPDPAQLLAGDALDGFFDEIRESEYDYVLLDGPPLLGLVDSQVLAQRVDGVIVVCRPDRLTSENAIDMRELLQRLQAPALGLVIIGGRSSPVSYFER